MLEEQNTPKIPGTEVPTSDEAQRISLPDRVTRVQQTFHVTSDSASEIDNRVTYFLKSQEQVYDRVIKRGILETEYIDKGWLKGHNFNLVSIKNTNPIPSLANASEKGKTKYHKELDENSLVVFPHLPELGRDHEHPYMLVLPQEALAFRVADFHFTAVRAFSTTPITCQLTVYPE